MLCVEHFHCAANVWVEGFCSQQFSKRKALISTVHSAQSRLFLSLHESRRLWCEALSWISQIDTKWGSWISQTDTKWGSHCWAAFDCSRKEDFEGTYFSYVGVFWRAIRWPLVEILGHLLTFFRPISHVTARESFQLLSWRHRISTATIYQPSKQKHGKT